jgi:hypothetical protein
MKIMFNGLDRPFGLLNLSYGCFAKHHSLSIYEINDNVLLSFLLMM